MPKINTKEFEWLVRSVHLGGIVESCVLSVHDNIGTIRIIDSSSRLYIACAQELGSIKNAQIGIPSMGLLQRVLSSAKEEHISYSIDPQNKWIRMRLQGQGQIKLLLFEPDTVPNTVADTEATKKLLENCPHSIQITIKDVANLLYFLNLFKSSVSALLQVTKGIATIENAPHEENQYKTRFSTPTTAPDMCTQICAEHLLAILNVLSIEGDDPPIITIHFAQTHPVIIKQSGTMWALSPMAES